MFIIFILLLMIAVLLLITCSIGTYEAPLMIEEPDETPHKVESSQSLGVVEYPYGETEGEEAGNGASGAGAASNEAINGTGGTTDETGESNPLSTEDGMEGDDEIIEDTFEIYSIEGTAVSMTGAAWERMLTWRNNAISLAENHENVIINMNPNENVVYLTFDDGPDANNTVKVIDTLIEYNVSATFFFTGDNMRRHRDVVRKTHEAGFSIGLHGYSHKSFRDLSASEITRELNESNELLETITGERSAIMRPPYGAVGDEEIELISGMDLTIYLWSLDTLDWSQSDANEILRNIKEYLRPGEIILMHAFSGQRLVPEILPSIIEFIRDEGFEIKALP